MKSLRRAARSEGGDVSHLSSILQNRQIIEIDDEDDDDVVEVPAPTTARSSTRQPSRYSLFVTPGPDENRTTGTPATRRSTSAMQARRASSAPRLHALSPHIESSPCIDLTGIEDSDEEAGDGNDYVASASPEYKEEESVQPEEDTTNGADEAADGIPADGIPAQLTFGTKRARMTSPASEGDGETNKRRKSNEVRTGSLPLTFPTWSWPRDV